MRWYVRFWWHNWRARHWKRRVEIAQMWVTVAETNQWHHESEWTAMKRGLKDYK